MNYEYQKATQTKQYDFESNRCFLKDCFLLQGRWNLGQILPLREALKMHYVAERIRGRRCLLEVMSLLPVDDFSCFLQACKLLPI